MAKNDIELSIIAPMYNEEANVQTTLNQIAGEMDKVGVEYEIIFVNDGSTDRTLEAAIQSAEKCAKLQVLSYFPNQGRGNALREGISAAKGKYIFTIDFDLTYDASHITRMYNTLKENSLIDAVFVSCYMPGGKMVGVPLARLIVSKWGNKALSYAFSQKIYTSTCVVRGYKSEVIKSLNLDSDDKEIHLEILSKLLALGKRIKEIPGTLLKRKAGKSHFRLKLTSISHVVFLLMERPSYHFSIIGFTFIGLSLISGVLLFLNRVYSLNETYVIFDFISPAFVILLFITGMFSLFFSLIGLLFIDLRKEILKIQAGLKKQ